MSLMVGKPQGDDGADKTTRGGAEDAKIFIRSYQEGYD